MRLGKKDFRGKQEFFTPFKVGKKDSKGKGKTLLKKAQRGFRNSSKSRSKRKKK